MGTRLVTLCRAVHERPRVEPEGGPLFVTDVGAGDDLLLNPLERIAALHHHRDVFLEPHDAVHCPSYPPKADSHAGPRCSPGPALPARTLDAPGGRRLAQASDLGVPDCGQHGPLPSLLARVFLLNCGLCD